MNSEKPNYSQSCNGRAAIFYFKRHKINNKNQDGWNEDKLYRAIQAEDVPLIKQIHLAQQSNLDLLGWHYTDSGLYTVKSGYWLATHLPDNHHDVLPTQGLIEFKEKIWKLSTAPKLKHFLWRMITHTLDVGTNIMHRRVINDPICKRCCREAESENHLFFTCDFAQAVWRSSGMFYSTSYDDFNSNFQSILEVSKNPSLSQFHQQQPFGYYGVFGKLAIYFFINGSSLIGKKTFQSAQHDTHVWINNIASTTTLSQRRPRLIQQNKSTWSSPPQGLIKCNYDCGFVLNSESKAAWIFRDSYGFFIKAGIGRGKLVTSPLEAEFQALIMAMQHAWSFNYQSLVFEGDNKMVSQLLNNKSLNFRVHNWVRDMKTWSSKFQSVQFQWTSRTNNKAADCLVKSDLLSSQSFVSFNYVPRCITSILHEDHTPYFNY